MYIQASEKNCFLGALDINSTKNDNNTETSGGQKFQLIYLNLISMCCVLAYALPKINIYVCSIYLPLFDIRL